MKRILRTSTLAGALASAVVLLTLSVLSPQTASAGPFRGMYGGYYNRGYAPGYGGYSGYGYSPYGNGAYTYTAPRAFVYPSYRTYEYSPGIGTAGTYNGYSYGSYGQQRYYTQPYRPAYNPYGYGGYGVYGGYGY